MVEENRRGRAGRRSRRALLTASAGLSVASIAGCSGLLGGESFETVQLIIEAEGVSYRGELSFQTDEGNEIKVPFGEAGSRSFELPTDLRNNSDIDGISTPIALQIDAIHENQLTVDEDNPFEVAVLGDGEELIRERVTSSDETIDVEYTG